jgi:hypothetical protein
MERRKCYCQDTYVFYEGTPESGSCGAATCTPPIDHVDPVEPTDPDGPEHRPQFDTTETPTPQRGTSDF